MVTRQNLCFKQKVKTKDLKYGPSSQSWSSWRIPTRGYTLNSAPKYHNLQTTIYKIRVRLEINYRRSIDIWILNYGNLRKVNPTPNLPNWTWSSMCEVVLIVDNMFSHFCGIPAAANLYCTVEISGTIANRMIYVLCYFAHWWSSVLWIGSNVALLKWDVVGTVLTELLRHEIESC